MGVVVVVGGVALLPLWPGEILTCFRIGLQERPVEVGDWRKNVEAMSGMEGRKKMFDAAKSPTTQ